MTSRAGMQYRTHDAKRETGTALPAHEGRGIVGFAMRIGIIGAGHAGVEAALAARQAGAEVVMFSAEPVLPYFRPRLVTVAVGTTAPDEIAMHPAAWYVEKGIDLRIKTPVTSLNVAEKSVVANGATERFDALVLACGSVPLRPSLPGMTATMPAQVLWSLADALAMRARMRPGLRMVVIGGGPIGIESALRATERGAKVVLVERVPRLMPGLLESGASAVLQRNLEVRGVQFFVGESVVSLAHGEKDSVVVALVNGQRLPADLVLLGIGAAPDVKLARAGGLPVGRSVIADANLQAAPGIFVAGDLCEANGRPARGAVKEAAAQGKLAGANAVASVTGGALQPFVPMTLALSLRCNGVELSVAGVPGGVGVFSERMDDGVQPEIYRGVTRRADSVVGVQMIGTREGFDEWAAKVPA